MIEKIGRPTNTHKIKDEIIESLNYVLKHQDMLFKEEIADAKETLDYVKEFFFESGKHTKNIMIDKTNNLVYNVDNRNAEDMKKLKAFMKQ
jgi:hypoxanthine phosphoribosyltransferase